MKKYQLQKCSAHLFHNESSLSTKRINFRFDPWVHLMMNGWLGIIVGFVDQRIVLILLFWHNYSKMRKSSNQGIIMVRFFELKLDFSWRQPTGTYLPASLCLSRLELISYRIKWVKSRQKQITENGIKSENLKSHRINTKIWVNDQCVWVGGHISRLGVSTRRRRIMHAKIANK